MAVLVSTKVKGQTTEGYDSVLMAVKDLLRTAPGFILHCAFPVPEEGFWQLHEVWASKEEADTWYAAYVAPNLPKGIYPKRSYRQLHSFVDIASLLQEKKTPDQ